MNTTPDIQREWLLSKWERFTDEELGDILAGLMCICDVRVDISAVDLSIEVEAEQARRQADVEADA